MSGEPRVSATISSPRNHTMPHAASPTYPVEPTLVRSPHPVLRQRASPVTVFDDDLRAFCERMFACMEDNRGIGLAAPQVAVSKRSTWPLASSAT